ncbi:1-acyl-sn-glycerol-3-phosphate acyltransferase [Perilla frutescens var. frutescens]|nr:1-acyl-sn-glycerol-3-phosphate acyltransferase [Perilla frutescens var. frutescens]
MASYLQIQYRSKNPLFLVSSLFNDESIFTFKNQSQLNHRAQTVNGRIIRSTRNGKSIVCGGISFPIDLWAAEVDSPAIATQLSALSLIPYLGFLYFITKSKSAPPLTLFGFYFLLAFVGAAIPAGIYAKVHYVKSLANVDWLHGGAESLLMLTNLMIVLGLRGALRKAEDKSRDTLNVTTEIKEKEKSSI